MSSFVLKLIAIISMTFDHVGATFFPLGAGTLPYGILFRTVGRLTMPIMCFCLGEGYDKTRNRKKYAFRLMFFALLSEVPYRLLFGNDGNVIFTLLIGYLALWLRDMVKAKTNSDIYAFFVFVGALVVSFLSGCDWGYIGILLVFAFYDGKKDRLKAVFYPLSVYVFVFLSALAEAVLWVGFDGFYINYIQFAGVLSVPVVLLYNGKRCPRIKYLFYFYYPLHMLLLVGISSLTGN